VTGCPSMKLGLLNIQSIGESKMQILFFFPQTIVCGVLGGNRFVCRNRFFGA